MEYTLAPCPISWDHLIGTKLTIEARAYNASIEFIHNITNENMGADAKVYAIAKFVHESFINTKKADKTPFLFRLRPYLTNELLPKFMRIKEGAIDSMYVRGKCDSAARTLVHLLDVAGYRSWQFNYLSPRWAHTVVLVQLPYGQTVLFDPTYGVASLHKGRFISPEEAQELQKTGVSLKSIWHTFGDTSALKYYRDFDRAVMAKQGEKLKLEISVTLTDNEKIQLGEKNNDYRDVRGAASQRGWSRSWHYFGHRYDRKWERIIRFPQRTRITFVLTSYVNPKFITSQRDPIISGKKVIYEIEAGGLLHFRDGLAKRDWLRLNSYQDIDYILFERIK